MKIRVDTNEMSYTEVDDLMQDLRKVRARKGELKGRISSFRYMINAMRYEEHMTLVSKTTGEILNPDDWSLYDEITHSFYCEEERE